MVLGRTIAAVALLIGIAFSFPLWTIDRGYPLVPLVEGFVLPVGVHAALVVALCALLIATAFQRRAAAMLAVIVLIILVFADQSRLQPWVFIEAGMLVVLAWEKDRRSLVMAALILASVYIYSGLQKLNPGFVVEVFPWVYGEESVLALGVPFVEIGIGVGLLTRRYRRLAIWMAVAMHLGILLALGPFGRVANSVIWPWNIAMIGFVGVVFRQTNIAWQEVMRPRSVAQGFVLILFGILPMLSFWGWWDKYLSFALYSGNTQYATITAPGLNIDVHEWSMSAMNVPAYPEERIYVALFQDICATSPDARMTIMEPLDWRLHHGTRRFTCEN